MSNIQYIIAEKLQDGTTRFTRSDNPEPGVQYINRRDEHDELVYVPTRCEDLYNVYIECRRGLHHFYDNAMKGRLDSLMMEKSQCNTAEKFRKAESKRIQAEAMWNEAEADQERLSMLVDKIDEIKQEMERADREGFARLFTE